MKRLLNLTLRVLRSLWGSRVVSRGCDQSLFFKPEQADSQLSQIISIGADRQLARAAERVCGLLPERRNGHVRRMLHLTCGARVDNGTVRSPGVRVC